MVLVYRKSCHCEHIKRSAVTNSSHAAHSGKALHTADLSGSLKKIYSKHRRSSTRNIASLLSPLCDSRNSRSFVINASTAEKTYASSIFTSPLSYSRCDRFPKEPRFVDAHRLVLLTRLSICDGSFPLSFRAQHATLCKFHLSYSFRFCLCVRRTINSWLNYHIMQ